MKLLESWGDVRSKDCCSGGFFVKDVVKSFVDEVVVRAIERNLCAVKLQGDVCLTVQQWLKTLLCVSSKKAQTFSKEKSLKKYFFVVSEIYSLRSETQFQWKNLNFLNEQLFF
jgi:hypothetical protein